MSLKDLKNLIEAKQGYNQPINHNQFHDIIEALEGMYSIRNNATCIGHVRKDKYTDKVSYMDLANEINRLKGCSCNINRQANCNCENRTGTGGCESTTRCSCQNRTGELSCSGNSCYCQGRSGGGSCSSNSCDCQSRTSDSCQSNMPCYCDIRTASTCTINMCTCKSRGPFESCSCYNVAGVPGACTGFKYNNVWCDCNVESCSCQSESMPACIAHCTCKSRSGGPACQCNVNCSCQSRTSESSCSCNINCSCQGRTSSNSCDSLVYCTCQNRTSSNGCDCNGRCSCDSDHKFE